MDQEEFYISPLSSGDVILGAPWFHRMAAKLVFPSRIIFFNHRNRDISIMIEDHGNMLPIVSHASLQKSIKKSLFAYLIFVNDLVSSKESYANIDHEDQMNFLRVINIVSLLSYLMNYPQCMAMMIIELISFQEVHLQIGLLIWFLMPNKRRS